jgi:hypothetical protein
MKEQNAAKPVWRWNVVGDEDEVDVESDGARFSAAAAGAAAGVDVAAVVEPDVSLDHRGQMVLTASRSA